MAPVDVPIVVSHEPFDPEVELRVVVDDSAVSLRVGGFPVGEDRYRDDGLAVALEAGRAVRDERQIRSLAIVENHARRRGRRRV